MRRANEERSLRENLKRDIGDFSDQWWEELKATEGAGWLLTKALRGGPPWAENEYYDLLVEAARDLRQMCLWQGGRRRTQRTPKRALRLRPFLSEDEAARFQGLEALRKSKGIGGGGVASQLVVVPDRIHGAVFTLTMPGWLSWGTVASIYTAAQMGSGIRKPTSHIGAKTSTLFREAVVEGARLVYRERMKRWNLRHPNWRYTNVRRFHRACSRAESLFVIRPPSSSLTVVRPMGKGYAHSRVRAQARPTVSK